MPNGNIHKTAGAVIGSITYLAIKNDSQKREQADLGELILSTSIGLSTSRLPDILEPAIHPNHRAFYHSLTFGCVVGFVGVQAWKDFQLKRNERKVKGIQPRSPREYVDVAIILTCSSILLHLVMDGFTKKGLNII
ncbi:MAG: metal-dependent hydrolase [bacterium]|nr:metal-dependent hydrolase [bacterium]